MDSATKTPSVGIIAVEQVARAMCEDNVARIHAAANARGGSSSMSGSEDYMYPPHGWPDFLASVKAGLQTLASESCG